MNLTNRTGKRIKAKVTFHIPIHARAMTACGRLFSDLRSQEFNRHQTSACADFSDVNCPECHGRAAYIRRHFSLSQNSERGDWRALWVRDNGTVFAEYIRPTREAAIDEARRQWGHLNFQDEVEAFAEIFPLILR